MVCCKPTIQSSYVGISFVIRIYQYSYLPATSTFQSIYPENLALKDSGLLEHMYNNHLQPHILSIIGMHRSGTSLTAQYLGECGLFIGHDLLGENWSNPGGHFEDKEFIEFHNAIFKAHHVNYAVSSHINWKMEDHFIDRAKAILEKRNSFSQWGWKDPRTTLFLPFWKKLIPGCHFVIVYRHYLPVVRSLISRDILLDRKRTSRWQRMMNPRFTKDVITDLFNKYLRTWIWYNKEIILHILNDPDVKYHFVTYDQLVRGDFSSLNDLQNHGFKLSPPHDFNRFPKRAPFIKKIPSTDDKDLLSEADAIDRYFSGIGRDKKDSVQDPPE